MAHWLKATETTAANFARFETINGSTVNVLAIIGASEYIDRPMTHAEARAVWRRLKAAGWLTMSDFEARSTRRLSVHRLRDIIHA